MLQFKWTPEWLFVLQTRFLRTAHHPNDLQESNEIVFIGLTVKNTQWDGIVEILGINGGRGLETISVRWVLFGLT